MDKLDRLGWAGGTAFRAFGLRIGIRVNQPGVPEALEEAFPPGWKPTASPVVDRLYSLRLGGSGSKSRIRRFNLLYADSSRVARSMELGPVIERLESDLQLFVAVASPSRLFVHAGVVGWRSGAILLPGRSFSGKSTLVAALVRAGARYYSDEFAVLDARGRVHPYPRPLSIRKNLEDPARRCLVEELGGRVGSRPLPVRLVVLSEYKAGSRWRSRSLSPAQAVLALLGNTVSARLQPEFALTTLRHAVSEAIVIKGARGEAEQAVESILDQLRSRAA
jgi:hypothetical protein